VLHRQKKFSSIHFVCGGRVYSVNQLRPQTPSTVDKLILDGNYACLSDSFSYHVMIMLPLTLAELLCDNTRLFISWQNLAFPLRFLSDGPGCGAFDPADFPSAKPKTLG